VWVRDSEDRRLYLARLDSLANQEGSISLEFRRPPRSRKGELRVGSERSAILGFRGPDHKPHQITRRFNPAAEVFLRFDGAPKADRIPFLVRRWKEDQRAY
jgi:hypothetical protein